jgi:DNA-binding beta-propeller fold protein YncE
VFLTVARQLRRFVFAGISMVLATAGVAPPADAVTVSDTLYPATAFVAVQGPCCGHGTVVAVSPYDGTIKATIPVGGTPTAVAITPDATTALVTNTFGYVSVIDASSLVQLSPISVCNFASSIAITPNGRTAGVTCPNDSTLELIDLLTGTVGTPIVVGTYPSLPSSVAVSPDGSTAYVVDFNGRSPFSSSNGDVVPVSIATGTVGATIHLSGVEATGVAITPDGHRLLVGVWGDTTSGSAIDVIDTGTNAVTDVLPVPTGPTSIAITADGATAYVSCRLGNTIFPISLDGSEAPPPRLGIGTSGIAVTPDAKILLSAADGVLDILDAHSLLDVGFVLTDDRAVAVAVTPDQAPRASLRISKRQRKVVTLDASASLAPSTPIVTYAWDFGDGTTSVTSAATVTHRYRARRNYTTTVTLTDAAGTSLQQSFTGQTVSRNGGPSASISIHVDLRH